MAVQTAFHQRRATTRCLRSAAFSFRSPHALASAGLAGAGSVLHSIRRGAVGTRLRTAVFGACLVASMVAAPSAHAAFPSANGKIAFVRGGDIWTMNSDGSDQVNLTSVPTVPQPLEENPDW